MAGLTKAQFDILRKQLSKTGNLTTSGVLLIAQKESSPLHKLFEWDDTVAATNFRKIQARTIIKKYNITVIEPGDKIVHVPSVSSGEGVYKETRIVVKSITDFELAMDEALTKLKAAEKSVSLLQGVAQKEQPDKAGILAVVMEGLNTANIALNKLH